MTHEDVKANFEDHFVKNAPSPETLKNSSLPKLAKLAQSDLTLSAADAFDERFKNSATSSKDRAAATPLMGPEQLLTLMLELSPKERTETIEMLDNQTYSHLLTYGTGEKPTPLEQKWVTAIQEERANIPKYRLARNPSFFANQLASKGLSSARICKNLLQNMFAENGLIDFENVPAALLRKPPKPTWKEYIASSFSLDKEKSKQYRAKSGLYKAIMKLRGHHSKCYSDGGNSVDRSFGRERIENGYILHLNPLQQAALMGKDEHIKALLDSGARPETIKTSFRNRAQNAAQQIYATANLFPDHKPNLAKSAVRGICADGACCDLSSVSISPD